jgi:hypothetical protein
MPIYRWVQMLLPIVPSLAFEKLSWQQLSSGSVGNAQFMQEIYTRPYNRTIY